MKNTFKDELVKLFFFESRHQCALFTFLRNFWKLGQQKFLNQSESTSWDTPSSRLRRRLVLTPRLRLCMDLPSSTDDYTDYTVDVHHNMYICNKPFSKMIPMTYSQLETIQEYVHIHQKANIGESPCNCWVFPRRFVIVIRLNTG